MQVEIIFYYSYSFVYEYINFWYCVHRINFENFDKNIQICIHNPRDFYMFLNEFLNWYTR